MGDKGKRPIWMPTGGVGALLFWVALSLFLGASTFYYFDQAKQNEEQEQVLQSQQALLFQENEKLRSQVDKLQSDLAEKGSILLNREQILQQTTESLRQVQQEKEEKDRLAALPPPDPDKPRHELYNQLLNALKTQPLLAGCTLLDEKEGVILRVNNTLLFNPGELSVKPEGQELIKALGALIKLVPMAPLIELQSHTDNTPPSAAMIATYPTNWELSARRVSAILHVLSDQGGVPVSNLKAVAMGDSRPIAPNDTKENRQLNRRLDVIFQAK